VTQLRHRAQHRAKRIIVRKQARLDAIALLDPIALDSLSEARRLANALEVRYRRLAISGSSLRIRPEYGADIRVALFKAWLIFFRTTDDSIIILRVLHGRAHPLRNRAKVDRSP
jgi:plasmid stabilization system protein ParE